MAQALTFGLTLIDELGTPATTNAFVTADSAQTLAQIDTAATAWAAAIEAASSAVLESVRVTIHASLPGGIKTTADAGSRVEQTAVINLRPAGTTRRWGVAIPAIKDALIVAGKLNLTDTAVTTITGLLQGAVLAGTYSTPYGNALGALVDAVLSFRKRRKSLSRSSFEV